MTSQLIANALALICAWSQPHCLTKDKVTIVQPISIEAGGSSWYDSRNKKIILSSKFNKDYTVGVLLVHELVNAEGDWTNGLSKCVENETAAYTADRSFWTWYLHSSQAKFINPFNITPDEAFYFSNLPIRDFYGANEAYAKYACSLAHM